MLGLTLTDKQLLRKRKEMIRYQRMNGNFSAASPEQSLQSLHQDYQGTESMHTQQLNSSQQGPFSPQHVPPLSATASQPVMLLSPVSVQPIMSPSLTPLQPVMSPSLTPLVPVMSPSLTPLEPVMSPSLTPLEPVMSSSLTPLQLVMSCLPTAREPVRFPRTCQPVTFSSPMPQQQVIGSRYPLPRQPASTLTSRTLRRPIMSPSVTSSRPVMMSPFPIPRPSVMVPFAMPREPVTRLRIPIRPQDRIRSGNNLPVVLGAHHLVGNSSPAGAAGGHGARDTNDPLDHGTGNLVSGAKHFDFYCECPRLGTVGCPLKVIADRANSGYYDITDGHPPGPTTTNGRPLQPNRRYHGNDNSATGQRYSAAPSTLMSGALETEENPDGLPQWTTIVANYLDVALTNNAASIASVASATTARPTASVSRATTARPTAVVVRATAVKLTSSVRRATNETPSASVRRATNATPTASVRRVTNAKPTASVARATTAKPTASVRRATNAKPTASAAQATPETPTASVGRATSATTTTAASVVIISDSDEEENSSNVKPEPSLDGARAIRPIGCGEASMVGVPVKEDESSGGREQFCNLCSKSFESTQSLQEHVAVCSVRYPLECTHCGKGFWSPYRLKCHIRVHTGVRPFKCQLCQKSYIQRNRLNSHMSTKHGMKALGSNQRYPRVYVCEECGQIFHMRIDLLVHQKIQHPDDQELTTQ